MRRITTMALAFAALLVMSAMVPTPASAVSAPHWGGPGAKGKVTCWLWLIPVYGWFLKSECEENSVSRGTYSIPPRWAHPVLGAWHSDGGQKFSNSTQSIECSELTANGGIYDEEESESMNGLGLEEFIYSGCKVWKGHFTSELKECEVTSLEGGLNTGKPDVINFDTNTELVYLNREGTSLADLFTGSGKELARVDFAGLGCVKSSEQELLGSVLAEVAPEDQTSKSDTLTFPITAKSSCWQWTLPATVKACETVKLTMYESPTIQAGEDSFELLSKEAFGAYD
jgi:hypothetical protein